MPLSWRINYDSLCVFGNSRFLPVGLESVAALPRHRIFRVPCNNMDRG